MKQEDITYIIVIMCLVQMINIFAVASMLNTDKKILKAIKKQKSKE